MATIDRTNDYRIAAVIAYATEHYATNGWDFVIETMTDADIYEIIKTKRTEHTAIQAMREHIAYSQEARRETMAW